MNTLDPNHLNTQSTDKAKLIEDGALLAFRHLARSQPKALLAMLLAESHRTDGSDLALDVLDYCGVDLSPALNRHFSADSKTILSDIATSCVYDKPEALNRLTQAIPGLWNLIDHGTVFRSLCDALRSSSNSYGDACTVAAQAYQWIGKGLSPKVWSVLVNDGGPAWRAFRDIHASDARAHPAWKLTPADIDTHEWKSAFRASRTLGMTGHGIYGSWPGNLATKHVDTTNRLAVAFGLHELLAEMSTAVTTSGNPASATLLLDGRERLGLALSFAVDHDLQEPCWMGFVQRVLQALPTLGLLPCDIVCPIPQGYALPIDTRKYVIDSSRQEKTSHCASLPDILSMSRAPALRMLGFSLGSDASTSFALWRKALLVDLFQHDPFSYTLQDKPSDKMFAIIEAQELSMVSSATLWNKAQKEPAAIQRKVRL